MKKSFTTLALLFCVLVMQSAHATQVTVWYQPTPYPANVIATIPESATHFTEGWVVTDGNSTPIQLNGATLQQDDWLYVGGQNTNYRYLTYLKFDLTGLPKQVDSAVFWLDPASVSSPWTSTPYGVCPVLGSWNALSSWSALPPVGQCADWYPAPVANTWAYFCATNGCGCTWCDWYTQWQNGTLANNGVMIHAQNFNYNIDPFVSSRYPGPYDGARPILGLTFASTLDLKMPLPGNINWLVTTEIGGYDCRGTYDKYHDDAPNDQGVMQYNYFSVDFSWKGYTSKDVNGNPILVYPNPDPTLNRLNNGVYIPVIAAAGGKVIYASPQNTPDPYNGYYVIIDHDSDMLFSTGFQTRYIHLQPPGPIVAIGDVVVQGQTIGYMGNTGLSDGAHLHFGVRYQNSGAKTSPELAKVVMDGWILKSFQTECLNGTWNRFYRSGNTVY